MISISAALSCAEAKLRCHGTMLIMKNKNVPEAQRAGALPEHSYYVLMRFSHSTAIFI